MPNYRSTVTPPAAALASFVRRDQAVSQILGAINAANQQTTAPQRDAHVEGILKQWNQGRFKGVEHLVAVGFNLIDRRAPLALVEEPGLRYVSLMRGYHAVRWGVRGTAVAASLASLWLAERLAHAEREVKLALFVDDRSYHHATQLLTASGQYARDDARFTDFIRLKAVEAEGGQLAVARAE